MVGQVGQNRDCQGTLNERRVGISEIALEYYFNWNFEIPNILGNEESRCTKLLEEFSHPGVCIDCKKFLDDSSQLRHFESVEIE